MRGKARQQGQARRLRSLGFSTNEISEKLDVSKSSVSLWVRGTSLSSRALSRLNKRMRTGREKISVANQLRWREYRRLHPLPGPDLKLRNNLLRLRVFFAKWSDEMAYILGFFAADGCMYHSANGGHSTGGWYIVFYSTDLQLLATIKEIMQIRNKVEKDTVPPRHKTKYLIRIVNRDLYKRFLGLGMTPSKSLTLRFPEVPKKYLSSFVRGYFDGDGHVSFGKYQRRDAHTQRYVLETGFTSGSHKFLAILQERLLKEAKMGKGSLHPHFGYWELSYSVGDSRQLYNFMYPTPTVPCLKRKRDIFEKAFVHLDS